MILRYAAALIAEARSVSRSLRNSPLRGRLVPEIADNAVRELFVKSYRMIYQVRSDTVVVLAFIHGARRLPAIK